MFRKALIFALIGLFCGPLGLAAKTSASMKEVERTLASYRQSRTFKAKVKKTITQELMGGDPSQSEGDFYFSKGRLRLQIEKPEPTLLVYDGKTVWFESKMTTENGEKVIVTKMKSQQLKKNDSLLAALFDRRDFLKLFKLVKSEADGELKNYSFIPQDSKKSEVQTLALSLNLKSKEIRRITYTDSVENKIEIDFLKTEKTDVPQSTFQYQPPKGADITEI